MYKWLHNRIQRVRVSLNLHWRKSYNQDIVYVTKYVGQNVSFLRSSHNKGHNADQNSEKQPEDNYTALVTKYFTSCLEQNYCGTLDTIYQILKTGKNLGVLIL